MKLRKATMLAVMACAIASGGALMANRVVASDHDDGVTEAKVQNTNLTDLYVFTEKSQNPSASANDLIVIMNLNPRSMAGKQYHFNQNARYEVHFARVSENAAAATGKEDARLTYEFSAPNAQEQQTISVSATRDGKTVSGVATGDAGAMKTTPIKSDPITNNFTMASENFTVYAGTREDPFFFDVDQFFRVRTSAAERAGGSTTPQVTFRKPGVDFTAGFNVLSIVTRVPRDFLQGETSATTFDVWETISVKK